MKWQTRMTDLLKIKYPIMEGAVAGVADVNLAAAVSKAGGLGMLTGWTTRTPERLGNEIQKVRSMTDNPFAVNLSPTVDPQLLEMLDVIIEERVPIVETAGSRAVGALSGLEVEGGRADLDP